MPVESTTYRHHSKINGVSKIAGRLYIILIEAPMKTITKIYHVLILLHRVWSLVSKQRHRAAPATLTSKSPNEAGLMMLENLSADELVKKYGQQLWGMVR